MSIEREMESYLLQIDDQNLHLGLQAWLLLLEIVDLHEQRLDLLLLLLDASGVFAAKFFYLFEGRYIWYKIYDQRFRLHLFSFASRILSKERIGEEHKNLYKFIQIWTRKLTQ